MRMKRASFRRAALLLSVAAAALSSASPVAADEPTIQTDHDRLVGKWIEFPLTYVTFRNFKEKSFSTMPDSATMTLASLQPEPMPAVLTPLWIENRIEAMRIIDEARYRTMIDKPGSVVYIQALLPDPPELTHRKHNLSEEIIADIPEFIHEDNAPVAIDDIRPINWLHTFNGAVQFSQAYLSPNWYQGGHNALTLLVNFFWNVKLNEVYHPNLLLDNTVSYKLALNSTPQDTHHNYSVSEDIFQWNFKFGVKAFKKWFYSLTTQFKTQLLNTYGENSDIRKASFLSPGSLNFGLGMTYSTTNKPKTLKFNASISPLSYNLNTCIDPKVDPVQYNIPTGAKTQSEIGSNAELTLQWQMTPNILWRSRLFSFTDYKYFLSDWENTFSFTINRFLSTQIYVHLRYDSSTEITDVAATKRWRYWMLKEMLSFGFSYSFSTK